MSWYFEVLGKYTVFSGRARRQEFWMFVLINAIIGMVLAIVDSSMGTSFNNGSGLFQAIYGLAVFLPTLALTVRRFHDVNKSGWFYLVAFIPILGAIWIFVITLTEGDSNQNQYGPNPKHMSRENRY